MEESFASGKQAVVDGRQRRNENGCAFGICIRCFQNGRLCCQFRREPKGSSGDISRASRLVQQAAVFVAKTNLELSENIPVRGKKEENSD